jgi:hypothetical protein
MDYLGRNISGNDISSNDNFVWMSVAQTFDTVNKVLGVPVGYIDANFVAACDLQDFTLLVLVGFGDAYFFNWVKGYQC